MELAWQILELFNISMTVDDQIADYCSTVTDTFLADRVPTSG